MPKFAANLSWLFTEKAFLNRFEAAAQAGFKAVEYLFPYEYEPAFLAEKLRENDLVQALFNLYPGNFDAGERGIAILPERKHDFAESVGQAISYAGALGCKRLHCMAGLIPDEADLFELEATYVSNLKFAANEAKKAGLTVLVEPINSVDMPGYYLNYTEQAAGVIEKVGADNLLIQYDVYHAQKTEGDLASTISRYFSQIGHIQIADNPNRHEPGTGEINFDFLFRLLDKQGYSGFVGCEYTPLTTTHEGLCWLENFTGNRINA